MILAGDHVYKMDYERMLVQHVNDGADVTVACLEVPVAEASAFGVMHVDAAGPHRLLRREAGRAARDARTAPAWALASMGIYVFQREFLNEQLRRDAADPDSSRDFGKDIDPVAGQERQGGRAPLLALVRAVEVRGREDYWRDVGTIDAYWEANIDLTDVVPELDLFDRDWPIWTYAEITPPAKFVHDVDGRRGIGISSLVSGGCIVSGASLRTRCCSPACRSTPTARSRTR